MYRQIQLSHVQRCFRLPYMVTSFGVSDSQIRSMRRTVHSDKLEFCLRLTAQTDFAVDRINGVGYRTPFPHLLIKRPGIPHDYAFQDQRKVIFFCYSSHSEAILHRDGFMPESLLLPILVTPEINAWLRELEQAMEHSLELGVADRVDLICLQLLEALILQERHGQDQTGDWEERIKQIASYLRVHFTDEIDFDALASSCGMSRSTFFRHWNHLFSLTPAQFLADLRMREAVRLLCETSESIGDIATKLNFCDTAGFCAAFKRRFQDTPRRYREKMSIV